MRLYPVVIATSRELTDSTELRGVQLPAGTILVVPFYSLNHDAAVWGTDVEQFRPERHEHPPENTHLFTPFGFGNRVCIGAKFATLEAEIAVVKLVSKFDITLPADGSGEPTEKLFLTMKPAGLSLCFNHL